MSNGNNLSNRLETCCANLVKFKQECDKIYNGLSGRDPSKKYKTNGSEMSDCGIWSSNFINTVLPFASDFDDVKRFGDQININADIDDTVLDIRFVMTRRRKYYAERESDKDEIDYVLARAGQLAKEKTPMLAQKYGSLPLYQCYQNMNLANLAWKQNINIPFRVLQRDYPKAEQLEIRSWQEHQFLVFQGRIEYIIFPRIILPLLQAYGVTSGADLKLGNIVSKKFSENLELLLECFNQNWSNKIIDMYYPGEDWLKNGGFTRMESASMYTEFDSIRNYLLNLKTTDH